MPEIFDLLLGSLDGNSPSWLFLVFFFGTFLSEDAACLLAGTAAANGLVGIEIAILSCLLGIFVGDLLLYAAGRAVGDRILDFRIVKRAFSEERLKRAAGWLNSNVASAVFASRLVSGLRLPTYILAGVLRSDLKKFAFYFFVAAAIWAPLIVAIASLAQTYVFPKYALLGVVLTLVVIRLIVRLANWKNRRMFVARVRRITNWEFWPLWVFYSPVIFYVIWLCIRYRRLVLTASNPSMPASGFVGESKHDIYSLIEKSPASSRHLLAYCKLPSGLTSEARFERATSLIKNERLQFPIVVKPDVGERGNGVRILQSEVELRAQMESLTEDAVIQEFANGVEASVFYFRFPTEQHGRIFSITRKEFPAVVGDGTSDLETLILRDPRAVCLAGRYFERNRDRLATIPAVGEAVQLIDIGTHSRGAIFHEGGQLRTPELERAIDHLSRGIDGFYFGRFDLRSASFAELMRGNFKVIELNGVTSESTNIYDRRYSLIDAYRILFRQWRIAFEIGAANRKLGAKCLSIREFIKLIFSKDASRKENGPAFLPKKASCA
jgi:membrane protein DedA with SNARE-associated domain